MSDQHTSLTEEAAKLIPQVYDDMLKPTIQESGKTASLIPRTINAALAPIRKWVLQREYNVAETEKLLSKKLQNIDPEKIVTPDAYVAVPALQAISYSMDSKELRNLYANLLAKSMNKDTKEYVHPSFVEIIKQLSSTDAMVFKIIMGRNANPLIDLVYEKNDYPSISIPTSVKIIATNISDIDIAPVNIVSLSIDNLAKQNLISIQKDLSYTDEHLYDKILSSSFYLEQLKQHSTPIDGYKFSHQKHGINKTNLGIFFYNICVADL